MTLATTSNATHNGHLAETNEATSVPRPYLLICTTAASGHFYPTLQITEHLIKQGFEATVITAEHFRRQVERAGARHVALPPFIPSAQALEERKQLTTGFQNMVWGLTHVVVKRIPDYHAVVVSTLESLRAERPGQQVVVLTDLIFGGVNPLLHGAPPPRGFAVRPPVLAYNVVPLALPGVDVGPWGLGLPPDSTEFGRARNRLLHEAYLSPGGVFGSYCREYGRVMEALGAAPPATDAITAMTTCPDVTLQACSPSLELPRSDLPAKIKFLGCLPCKTPDPTFEYPEWWLRDVISSGRPNRRKIIGVAQGTVAVNYNDLIIPTIQGFRGRDDVFVVAVLGVRGACLPAQVEIPANAKVVDFMPYEALLPHLDVWVINAGYGGFTQGVMYGIPMVFSGDTEDKAEVSMRGQCAGVGFNLRTASPTPEQVAQGVDSVLQDDNYKARVMEIRKENEAMKSLEGVEKHVWDLARRSQAL